MPVLSGNGGVKGGFIALRLQPASPCSASATARARLFVLLMVLIVATDDGLLCNTIKHAVARPRPFVTLPEARVFGAVGKGYVPRGSANGMAANTGSRNSMPSSHAANWFAATMVAFLFYRRSLVVHAAAGACRFLFPRLQRRALSQRRAGRRDSGCWLRRCRGHRAASRLESDREKNGFQPGTRNCPNLLNPESESNSGIREFHPIAEPNSQLRNRMVSSRLRPDFPAMLIGRWIYLASGAIELSAGRGVSMGLVQTPGAVVLQQAAGHRVHSVRRHLDFRRHGIRRPFFFAALRRDHERAAAAFPGPRNRRARRRSGCCSSPPPRRCLASARF